MDEWPARRSKGLAAFGFDSSEFAAFGLLYIPDQRRRFGHLDQQEPWFDFAVC
jgi:hypothetical protein